MLELCRRGETPLVAAVLGGRPESEGFRAYLEPLRNNRYVRGIRRGVTGERPGFCLQEMFVRNVRLLGEWGLRLDLLVNAALLGDGVRLVESCPDTRVILDHCGNPDVYAADRDGWRRDIDRLARFERVACKISGIMGQARPGWTADLFAPFVNHCLEAFGPERVVFAGDWPSLLRGGTLRQWTEAVRTIVSNRPATDQRKLFHDNAVRVYDLR